MNVKKSVMELLQKKFRDERYEMNLKIQINARVMKKLVQEQEVLKRARAELQSLENSLTKKK